MSTKKEPIRRLVLLDITFLKSLFVTREDIPNLKP